MNDNEELIAALNKLMREANEEPTLRPDPIAQALELQTRWTSAQEPSLLQPGDLVCEKRGLGNCTADIKATTVMILWRLLDYSDPVDLAHVKHHMERNFASFDRPDCLVAHQTDNGAALTIYPHQTGQLTRWVHPNIKNIDWGYTS